MRLKSDIFVAAILRGAESQGAVATLRRRGARDAGAVFVVVDRLDGRVALFGPAPQSEDMPDGVDRLFSRMHAADWVEPAEVEARLKRELAFDPDLWIVEIEDREGRAFVDLVK